MSLQEWVSLVSAHYKEGVEVVREEETFPCHPTREYKC